MVKTTAKRQSESALPDGRTKHLKTSARTNDASDLAGDESSDQLFVDQKDVAPKHIKMRSIKSRKSEPVKRTARSDEYDEDEGRMGSKQFLAMVEFYGENKKNIRSAKEATNYVRSFESKVDEEEESLKKRLQELGTEATQQDTGFMEAIQDAYAVSRPLAVSANVASQAIGQLKDISFATLFDQSQKIVENANLIIQKFENASQKISRINTSQLTDNNWEDENVQAAQILTIGRKVGLNKHEAMLMGASEPDIEEEDSVSASLMYPDTEGNTASPWGVVAKKSEKTMRKLLKAIIVETV